MAALLRQDFPACTSAGRTAIPPAILGGSEGTCDLHCWHAESAAPAQVFKLTLPNFPRLLTGELQEGAGSIHSLTCCLHLLACQGPRCNTSVPTLQVIAKMHGIHIMLLCQVW